MIFSFPPHIQAGIASGGYEIVTSKSGVALGIARDVATKRFVAHAIGTTVNPLFSLSELAIGGVQLIQTHRGFQRTFDMLTSLQHSVGVLQATTAVIGVSSIIGTAIAGVNLYQTLQLRREVKELKREIQDGFIAVLEQIDNLPDRVKFDNHRTILALAYGQFTEAVCLLELALAIEDNDARNITLGNAQNLLANALNAYSRPELFHEIHAPARLRRLECIWAMQSALALNFQLLKAPQAAIKTLTNLQQRIQQDAIAVIDACQSEAELDFLYPEISYIRAHDLPVLETWQNSIDWFQGLPESEREQLLALEIPQQQQPKEQQPLEVLEYDRLKEKSHYEALRDALKMSLQPQMRRNYEDYISDRVSRSQLQGLNSSNWQPISDLTVANLYHYFKAKG